ncbi:glycoside hydrolase family 2 protein [Cadophora sp. DSE1049]|nr:glycoside hydrolase family 2 protein [Cadophora sp. DSE1049]
MPQALQRTNLSSGWEFKQTDSDQNSWCLVKNVPSVVHLDLMENQKIPDPFIGLNELDVEWVGEKSWTYRTSFPAPALPENAKAALVFQGLDTFATVKLNGSIILESSNMFLSHRVHITGRVLSAGQNSLEIDFASALLCGRELEKEHPEYRFIAHNGETGRLGVRKARYHWGWDWGPVLMTAGPWRPIRLEVYEGRISDLWTQIEVDKRLKSASGTMFAKTEGTSAKRVTFSLKLRGDTIVTKSAAVDSDGLAKVDIQIDNPELWYPHGYGAQTMYEVTAELKADDVVLDTVVKKTSLRRGELIQDVDKIGKTFYFRVNNIDIFCAGSCWIPADNFIPRISEDRYRKWLQMMVDGRQVMTRVWGGGIYEEDVFYDLCDELGILVWQDFMFGCGSYPT